ncbi:dihydropteroate synthase [Amnimonas aquatica]|nr:dihydropteroate synthase [Amnimonas aquatica]
MAELVCGARTLDLARPAIMGILNVTPDSFSDGGRYVSLDAALRQAEQMLAEGARLIDVGAESTRPGAAAVGEQEELDRLLPVVEGIAARLDVVISVDTSTPSAIRESARLGAGLINDVRSLTRPGALAEAVASGLPVCLMHMHGEPDIMQRSPRYDDVLADVLGFLRERADACIAAGVLPARLVFDPGFGFGKSLAHNLLLLREFSALRALGGPLLVGVSRKSMLGGVLNGAPVDQRLHAGNAAALLAVERGARIVRTHDVRAMADVLALWQAQAEVGRVSGTEH